MAETQQEAIARLKDEYVEYFAVVPVRKYASMHIARDEDTTIRWEKEDAGFAGRVQRARAQWVKSRLPKAKIEFALERLEREIFGANLDITSKGEKLEVTNLTDEQLIEIVERARKSGTESSQGTET